MDRVEENIFKGKSDSFPGAVNSAWATPTFFPNQTPFSVPTTAVSYQPPRHARLLLI